MLLVNTFTGQSLSTFLLHGTLCAPGSRISDSPSLRHDNNILSTDNAIFPDKGEQGDDGGGHLKPFVLDLFLAGLFRVSSTFRRV